MLCDWNNFYVKLYRKYSKYKLKRPNFVFFSLWQWSQFHNCLVVTGNAVNFKNSDGNTALTRSGHVQSLIVGGWRRFNFSVIQILDKVSLIRQAYNFLLIMFFWKHLQLTATIVENQCFQQTIHSSSSTRR